MTPDDHRWLEIYLRFLIPWDDPKSAQLWKCVTTIAPKWNNPKDKYTDNRAVQTFDDILRLIDSRRNWRQANLFLALGLQHMADVTKELSKDGFVRAIRKAENMASLNALFLDVDVDPVKKDTYITSADAELGFKQFMQSSGMPPPTLIVRSGGGGFHVYWCTAEPMPITVWQQLAEALKTCTKQLNFKADPAITADAARILRIPTTINFKREQPVVVRMDTDTSFKQYAIADLTAALSKYTTVQRSKTGTSSTSSSAGASAWAHNFTANVDERSYPKLPIDTIAQVCPMTAQTLLDGGAGKSEPDWNQDMFLAAWTSDPADAAHRLSQGYSAYDPAEVDKKLAEKQAAIVGKGWPLCKSFNHPACQSCPYLQYDKSPILFAHSIKAQAQPVQPAYVRDDLMPDGWWRNINNHVITNGEFGPIDVLGYPIFDAGYDPMSGDLVLETFISGRRRWGAVSLAKQTPSGICEALTKGAHIVVKGGPKYQTIVKDFIMSWVQHLQQTKKTITPTSFGWAGNSFVFGDEKFTPQGQENVYRNSSADEYYQRVGKLQPWLNAMPLIYGNTPLEIVVASAFAGPLVELTCDNSLVLSIYSYASGLGKSTAMRLAQAVWASTREGMSMTVDTDNAAMAKITGLKNLPTYWDELKTKDQYDKIVSVVFSVTQGRSKARLSRDAKPMKIGSATTMLTIASNTSIADEVIAHTQTNEAGGLRLFEFETQPIVNKLPNSEALLRGLRDNYGVAGALFIDFIVRNKDMVSQIIDAVSDQLEQACAFDPKERFWKGCMITLLAGAHVANAMRDAEYPDGLTRFDIQAMTDFLMATLASMRSNAQLKVYAATGDAALGEVLADTRNRNLLITEYVPSGAGKPTKIAALGFDPGRTSDIWIQLGQTDGRVLARCRPFNDWMRKHGHSPKQVIEELRRNKYKVIVTRAAIGTGVEHFASMQQGMNKLDSYDITPPHPPAKDPNRNPSSPSANFGSP